MPDEDLNGDLHRLFAHLIERTPPLPRLNFDEDRRPRATALLRRLRTRPAWIAASGAIVAAAILLAFVLPSSSGIVSDAKLGLSVSDAAVTPNSHPGLTFKVSDLPRGFHLVDSVRETNLVTPGNSRQSATYERSSTTGSGKLTIAIQPATASGFPKVDLGP